MEYKKLLGWQYTETHILWPFSPCADRIMNGGAAIGMSQAHGDLEIGK